MAVPPAAPAARRLPEGTLTLLFSDIEGSTRLLARLGDRYAEVLSTQRAVLRAAFARWGGYEMGTEGDSFFVVFDRAGAAVRAATEGQQELARLTWPEDVTVRVRMGLHTGEPVRHEDGYVGMDVHRAARVAGVAHGGQVLLTGTTSRLAAADADLEVLDLGDHRLKDLPRPERLYQLCAPGLRRTFPPVRSLGARSALPLPATGMVGRHAELGRLTTELGGPGSGVLTLTGPGGVGKTRLALAAAAALEPAFPDGVYFVPLSAVRSGEVMWTSVADALGVTGESKAPPTFLQHLAPRRVLLVLDNVEQIADAGRVAADLAAAGPGVRVLATSRRPLHAPGEQELPVPPLPVPAAGAAPAEDSAVTLFLERARLVRPQLALTADNADDVVELCRALDGLPLAIELAAARSKLLGPRALRARLDQVLELGHTTLGVPERQRTLRATITWSYQLLPEHLQVLLCRLGVFSGWFDLPAVSAVAHPGQRGAGAPGALDLLDDLTELVDTNLLLVRDGPDGEPRFRLLRTIAAFARDQLAAAGEEPAARRRHAEHYLTLAREVRRQLRSEHHLAARDRLEGELDDVRGALAWALGEDGDPELGLELCDQLGLFWYTCGYQGEGRRWLGAAVAAGGGRSSDALARIRHVLAVLLLQQGEAARARDLLQESLAHWRRAGDRAATASELNSLGLARRALGEPGAARSLLREAVEVARGCADRTVLADALSNLATLLSDDGRYAEAAGLLQEVLEVDTARGDTWGIAADHVNLASMLLRAGRSAEAAEELRAHGEPAVGLGDAELTADVLELCCVLRAEAGEADAAARLLGAARALRRTAEIPLPEPDQRWLADRVARVAQRPTAEAWQANLQDGEGMSALDALRWAGGL